MAEAEFRGAAALALEIGREETVSQAYNNLGILYRITGDPHRARQMHREALAIADRLELHQQVTTACTNLGIACTEIGELSTAREMFGRALSISQQIGFEEAIAFCLAGIGRIHLIEEQPELALASLLDALQTIRRLDRSDATANILVNLAAVYGRLGKMLEATRHMQEAFDISRAIPDPLGEALAAFNLGALHHATGDDRVAREMWTIARDRYAGLGLTQQVADVDSRLKSLE